MDANGNIGHQTDLHAGVLRRTLGGFELLAGVLPRWGAAAVLCGLLLLGAALLGWWGWRRLLAIEPPLATASRHLESHLAWWQGRLLRSGTTDTLTTAPGRSELPPESPEKRK